MTRSNRVWVENLLSLILAFVVAMFIWVNASRTEDPIRTRFIEVPISYVGLPSDTVITDGSGFESVQMRLEGPDSLLQAAEAPSREEVGRS